MYTYMYTFFICSVNCINGFLDKRVVVLYHQSMGKIAGFLKNGLVDEQKDEINRWLHDGPCTLSIL